MKIPFKLVITTPILFTSILLSACSGHPGAGQWQSVGQESAQYSALELEFDGKGTLHPSSTVTGQEKKADLWCIWQAKSSHILDVQCGDEDHRDTKIKFELRVTEGEGAANNSAVLTQNDVTVAQFERKP